MTEADKILELKENMEQALDKLKRAISARNSWNGSAKHYKNQLFAETKTIRTLQGVVTDYTAAIRNAADVFNKAYDAYEPYMEQGEPVKLPDQITILDEAG